MAKTKSKRSTGSSAKPAVARAELATLANMGSAQLQKRYVEVFGKRATTCNVMQLRGAMARALLERAGEIAADAPVRAAVEEPAPPPRDGRLPSVGSVLRKEHDGVIHRVKVVERGFVYQGAHYRSLSAVAKAITGTTWNGFLWFGLAERAPKKRMARAA